MSSVPLPQQRFQLRAQHLMWTAFAVMLAYVLRHNERFLIDHADPYWQHVAAIKWWLLLHGVAGSLPLLLGPMQFSTRLRQRYTKLHRVVGRFYVVGALVVGPVGTYLQYRNQLIGGAFSFTLAAVTFAAAWMITTIVALAFAMKRKIQQHRQWMTRSYAFALIFLEVRVITGLGGWDKDDRIVEVVVWILLAAAPLLADAVLQWQELRDRKVLVSKAAAAD
jgi:uncharacterized membrane protein